MESRAASVGVDDIDEQRRTQWTTRFATGHTRFSARLKVLHTVWNEEDRLISDLGDLGDEGDCVSEMKYITLLLR